MKNEDFVTSLFKFIDSSPTAFHAVANVKERLIAEGYTELYENEEWTLSDGGKYFVIRNSSSVIAFRYKSSPTCFMIAASHSDSPSFKLKELSEDRASYVRIPTEKYGGMILYSWFDRPLSVAGRAVYKSDGKIKSSLVNIDRDLAVIPSVAIHFNRTVNDSFSPNPAVDMLPLLASGDTSSSIRDIISSALGVSGEDILSSDLFLYAREKGSRFGIDGEFIISPRLDDLACVYTSLEGFLSAEESGSIPVLAVFDSEEIGNATRQGAASTFLYDTLERTVSDRESYLRLISNSFMVSADNAHAKHPAHPELSDKVGAPILNGGVVVKYNANQRYTTDSLSAAIFKEICNKANAKTQSFYNRPDIPGGTTLGITASTLVPIATVDIGLPELAMHSAIETAGAFDLIDMIKAMRSLFSSSMEYRAGELILK